MLVAPQYAGIEIPVYDADTEPDCDLFNRVDIQNIQMLAQQSSSTFMRGVLLVTPSSMGANLTKILEQTDEHLAQIAQLCGTLALDHSWGLYKAEYSDEGHHHFIKGKSFVQYSHPALPDGHILVAEVPLLRHCKPVDDEESPLGKKITAGLKEYFGNCDGLWLWDMHLGQFARQKGQATATLLDIEPCWAEL